MKASLVSSSSWKLKFFLKKNFSTTGDKFNFRLKNVIYNVFFFPHFYFQLQTSVKGIYKTIDYANSLDVSI